MHIELAYGQHYLEVQVPDQADILSPKENPGLPDEPAALRNALCEPIGSAPLRERVRADDRVVIVFSDITRPMPNDRVLPALLAELAHVPRENILLLNGLGTHRAQTREELAGMLGAEIVRNYRVEQHDAWDEANLVDLGVTQFGHRAMVNRRYYEADFKIVTGFIEPHIFAGFSGGPKGVMPGVAGIELIMDNHGYSVLNDPRATWGVIEGNPAWAEMREVAAMAKPDFLLNVTVNRHRQLTGVYAGDIWEAHGRGVAFARESAMVPIEAPYDIILTTNSGYPLDINLYQAVKGMSCAAQIIRPGGSIVIAAECRDGVPEHGEYRNIVHEAGSVEGIFQLVGQPGYRRHDQWEALLQARIQQVADIYVHSDYLPDEEIRSMLMEPCHDIEATLAQLMAKYGPDARLCVLPDGPQTIPYLRSKEGA